MRILKRHIQQPDGATRRASLFVAGLGVSGYTFAEATPDQTLPNWLKVQMHSFEFYGAVRNRLSRTTQRPA